MATMVSGNSGRLKSDGNTIATIKSWRLTKTTAAVAVPNFESPTSGSLVYPEVLAGLSGATLTVEGQFDVDPATATDNYAFSNGDFVTLDLILEKTAPWGYDDVYALCTSFAPGANIENQASSFTAEFTVSGVAPTSGVVT